MQFRNLLLLAVVTVLTGCSYRTRVAPTPIREPARREIQVQGVAMSYEFIGDTATSRPVLVMLHGFGASLESWDDILPAVAREHPVLRIDLKGFGQSSKPRDGRYEAVDQAELVVGIIRALGVRRPVLVGHSFGGAVAFTTYLRLREGGGPPAAGLVLIDAGVYDQPLPFFIAALRSQFTRWLMYTFTTPDWRAELVLKRAYEQDSVATPERITRYARYFDVPGAHYAFEETARDIVPPDAAALEEKLKTIAVPTLVLWGVDDEIIDVRFARRLRQDVPGVVVKTLDDTGHSPHEERPAETARLLLEFLATLR